MAGAPVAEWGGGGGWSEWTEEVTLVDVVSKLASLLMIFGGVVPFVPQYREIRRKGDAEGFSLYVCLVLLVANILRVLYWCGSRFSAVLLVQSLIMIVTMLFMIHVCVSVRNKGQIIRGPDRLFTDFEWRYFWQWTDLTSYVEFLLSLTLLCSLLTFLMQDSGVYMSALGYLSTFTEAMLAMPQLFKNFRNKSTEGMSVLMVLMWLAGDIFKTVYFVLKQQPKPFWVCGSLQISIDLFILGQVYWFRRVGGGEGAESEPADGAEPPTPIWYTRMH